MSWTITCYLNLTAAYPELSVRECLASFHLDDSCINRKRKVRKLISWGARWTSGVSPGPHGIRQRSNESSLPPRREDGWQS